MYDMQYMCISKSNIFSNLKRGNIGITNVHKKYIQETR